MYKFRKINLQLFAEVGATNTTGTVSAEMQTHYNKTLIDRAGPHLVHEQFAAKRNLPLRAGATVDFRCVEALPKATTPLEEGVTPAPGKVVVTNKRATVEQYGSYVPVSDKLELMAADPIIVEMTEKSGDQMGLTRDTIIRDIMNLGTQVMYVPSRAADGTVTEVQERKALTLNCKITVKDVQRAVARLRMMNAPTIDGKHYGCIINPAIELDIMDPDGGWWDANKYATPENIKEGEIGRMAGVRFFTSSEAKIFNDETCPDGLAVYSCLFFGKDAYAVTDLEGAGTEMIIKPKESGGTANPLNLYGTIGWKTLFTGVILSDEYLLRMECTSSAFPAPAAN